MKRKKFLMNDVDGIENPMAAKMDGDDDRIWAFGKINFKKQPATISTCQDSAKRRPCRLIGKLVFLLPFFCYNTNIMSKKAKRKNFLKYSSGVFSFCWPFLFSPERSSLLDSHAQNSRRRLFKRLESRPIHENLRPDGQNNPLGHPQRHPKDGGALGRNFPPHQKRHHRH